MNNSYPIPGSEEDSLFSLKGEAEMNEKIEAVCAIIMVIIEVVRLFMEIKKGPEDKSGPFFEL